MIANILTLGAVGAWLLSFSYPLTRAVRARNALLLRASRLEDFDWSPSNVPTDFVVEHASPLPAFATTVQQLGLEAEADDWERALRLASYLADQAKDCGPIQSDLQTTFDRIRQGYGYCADFVKVFLGLAYAADVFARQWTFAFDDFGGHGHVIAEIFDRKRGKWLFLDVHNNFHAVDVATNEPISALEFREYLLGRRQAARMVRNGPGRLGYRHSDTALDYYRRGLDQWYLLWGNAVFSYDAQPLVRGVSRISGEFGQVVAIALGVHPQIRVLPTNSNAASVQRLRSLGHILQWGLAVFCSLCLLLLAQVVIGAFSS